MTAFNYTSGNINNLDAGDSLNMMDIKGPFQDVQTFFNARTFNEDNLPVSLLQKLGLSDSSGQKGRGKSIISQSESRTNTAYGTLTTPDQITGLVLPTDGLIFIAFHALISQSVNNAARAAFFLGANQLIVQTAPGAGDSAGVVNEAAWTGLNPTPVHSVGNGIFAINAGANSALAPATTGVVVGDGSGGGGGIAAVFAAAGTYTISVQVKSTSGSVTMSNRRLWAWVQGF